MSILVVIPARSGSKSLPHKNILNFRGKPMLAWSITHAIASKHRNNMRIIVTTDSPAYAEIAKAHGAEVPFLRPKEISQDNSTDLECIQHALSELKIIDNYIPDIIVHLRPTQPCRTTELLDKCIDLFLKHRDSHTSLRTVIPLAKSPFKMYTISDTELVPVCREINGIKEPYNLGRQQLPQAYLHNGYVDIILTQTISNGSMTGSKILPYVMNETDNVDIDSSEDLAKAK
jgi:CMP-N,N'-diacetyllegionaminic acid synthase